jgi:hypothetical protein
MTVKRPFELLEVQPSIPTPILLWVTDSPKKDAPLDVLQKRFASGAISKEQYLENKKLLEKG